MEFLHASNTSASDWANACESTQAYCMNVPDTGNVHMEWNPENSWSDKSKEHTENCWKKSSQKPAHNQEENLTVGNRTTKQQ